MQTISVTALFNDIGENMLRFFQNSDTNVPHPGEKGGIRERRVKEFLQNYLPGKYSVASGHIIDREGRVSLHEDIVIFDGFNCPIFEVDDHYRVFPCEAVYASVEVKSVLDPKEIKACIEHTSQLRNLDRGSLGPIESFVFAYDSYPSVEQPPPYWAAEKFISAALANIPKDAPLRPVPSVILSLKKNFVLYLGNSEIKLIPQGVERGILLFYLDVLLKKLSRVQTAPPSPFFTAWEKDNPIKHYTYSLNIDWKECHY